MLKDRGYWVWNLTSCEPAFPDPWALISRLVKQARASYIIVKVSDGGNTFNDPEALSRLVAACRTQKIGVWGFGYGYGQSVAHATNEGMTLGDQCKWLGLDGAVADLEGQFEVSGSAAWAKAYCEAVKSVYSGPLAISSFWSVSLHSLMPWHTLCAEASVIMPQVYTGATRDAALTLRQSHDEFAPYLKAYPHLQFVPTVAINADDGGGDPAKVTHFCAEADALGLASANAWVVDEAIPGMLSAFAAWTPKGVSDVNTKNDPAHLLQGAIEARLAGATTYTFPNGTPCADNDGTPILNKGGECQAFARCGLQAAGYHCPDPNDPGNPLFKGNAQATGEAFEAAGYGVPVDGNLYRNDLLFFTDGSVGHVVTYMGVGQPSRDTCLENTSGYRGVPYSPGVKYTALQDILNAHGGQILRVIRYTGG